MRITSPEVKTKFNLPAEGIHTAKLVEYEDLGLQPNPYKDGAKEPKVKLVFELEDGSKQFHWISPKLSPLSKFYGLAAALLGTNPGPVLEMDDLIGLECEVEVEHYTNAQNRERSKIVDFRRLRKPNPQTKPQPAGGPMTNDDIPF